MRQSVGVVCILLLAVNLLHAQPTTQPIKPKPDERQVIDKTFGYSFNVPKIWINVPQKGERSIHIYQMPAPGGYGKAASSFIILVEPNADKDFNKIVDRMRETLLKRNKDAKLEIDKAATVLGHAGWEFVYTMKMQVTVTSKVGKKQMQETEDFPAKVRTWLFVYNDALHQVIVTSDQPGFAARIASADRVLKSFVLGPEDNRPATLPTQE